MPLGYEYKITLQEEIRRDDEHINQINDKEATQGVQAERINDANLTLIINDLGQAEPSFANEPEAGHAARSVNSADYAARLEFQDLRKAAPDVHPS
ncbi:uncharacterized protein LOC142575563 isoform X5 [Dermacentor variabilis]|uniref:uncharacterized protein LOC142575563 isoform X5 n=1 Tax=Dermacentor variabilis TaxID=34621 RepID=UPI003F5B5534